MGTNDVSAPVRVIHSITAKPRTNTNDLTFPEKLTLLRKLKADYRAVSGQMLFSPSSILVKIMNLADSLTSEEQKNPEVNQLLSDLPLKFHSKQIHSTNPKVDQ